MSRADISPGACGFTTRVEADMEGAVCRLEITSECEAIQNLAAELHEVDPYREISFHKETPYTLKLGARYCAHAACPVPVGIIKAVEVAAGLNVPVDVTINVSQ